MRVSVPDILELFIIHMNIIKHSRACLDIASLTKNMVEFERRVMFTIVYCHVELALILPVMTVKVERAFSVMKIIKTELRNWIYDGLA